MALENNGGNIVCSFFKRINERFLKDFNKFLEEDSKPKTYTNTSTIYKPTKYNCDKYIDCTNEGFVQYSDKIEVYFYEWSDIENNVRHYNSLAAFYDYCKESGIIITEYQRSNVIKTNNTYFMSCYPNKSIIMIRDTYEELKRGLAMANKY